MDNSARDDILSTFFAYFEALEYSDNISADKVYEVSASLTNIHFSLESTEDIIKALHSIGG